MVYMSVQYSASQNNVITFIKKVDTRIDARIELLGTGTCIIN